MGVCVCDSYRLLFVCLFFSIISNSFKIYMSNCFTRTNTPINMSPSNVVQRKPEADQSILLNRWCFAFHHQFL